MSDPALMDPPAPRAEPPPAPAGPLADLIPVRLLTEKKALGEKRLLADLAVFFRRPPPGEQFAAARDALREAGLVAVAPRGGTSLTDAGRTRALAYLGVEGLMPKANWGTVKAKHLVPKALGTTADAVKGEKLAATVLKRKLGLPVGTQTTLKGVFEAIACRELGYEGHATFATLLPVLLGKAAKADEPLDPRKKDSTTRILLNATPGLNGIRAVALAALGDGQDAPAAGPSPDPADEPFDLEAFAATVRSVARTSPTGRFGGNKVFISHVWRQLADHPQIGPLGAEGFKRKLVEANRVDLLTLSRADLVQVMDPADVRESEIAYLNATFHFILLDKE